MVYEQDTVVDRMCSCMGQAFGFHFIWPEKQQLCFVMRQVSLCISVVGEKEKSRLLFQRFLQQAFLVFQAGNPANHCWTRCVAQERLLLRRRLKQLVSRRVCYVQGNGNRVFFVSMTLIENLPRKFFLILKIVQKLLQVRFMLVILIQQ